RRLEAIHVGHVHVEQNDGEVLSKKLPQRLAPRIDAHNSLAKFLQDDGNRQQFLRHVVNYQDSDFVGRIHCDHPAALEGRRLLREIRNPNIEIRNSMKYESALSRFELRASDFGCRISYRTLNHAFSTDSICCGSTGLER